MSIEMGAAERIDAIARIIRDSWDDKDLDYPGWPTIRFTCILLALHRDEVLSLLGHNNCVSAAEHDEWVRGCDSAIRRAERAEQERDNAYKTIRALLGNQNLRESDMPDEPVEVIIRCSLCKEEVIRGQGVTIHETFPDGTGRTRWSHEGCIERKLLLHAIISLLYLGMDCSEYPDSLVHEAQREAQAYG